MKKDKEKEEIDEQEKDLNNPQEPESEDNSNEGAADEETQEATDPLEAANKQIAELNDKFLRKVAEFDNYRKRTLKEKADLILNGAEKTLTKILPVIDDIERAIENGNKTDDVETLREGMDLIYKKFMKILKGEGVEVIPTTGEDFNTDYHEAIAMVPGMGDENKGKVIDCVQTGYTLNGKVIRYAKVAVGQ
ncbi:MAG: nucleotide exchange factor GrpE [Prevotella sp.]|nr:nucleotide exchange factor GrpE [Prevotella sp.]MBQ4295801.1 nucleotide exchange factor GrpE [Prevotella sp.]MBR7053957.1 nucleotide exchange factor GrpE [Prevotella sp.]